MPKQEVDIKAERGAYMLCDTVELPAGAAEHWSILADVNKGPVEVANLMAALERPEALHGGSRCRCGRGFSASRGIGCRFRRFATYE